MPSAAFKNWEEIGQQRLDELLAIHQEDSETIPEDSWGAKQFNRSLFVALIAQFQMYCVEVYDLAVIVHVRHSATGHADLLQTLLTRGRKLTTRNPRTDNLGSDFGRLGFRFIDELKKTHQMTASWLKDLDELVDFRNAIAHGNETEIALIERKTTLCSNKQSFLRYRKILMNLTLIIDQTISNKISESLKIEPIW